MDRFANFAKVTVAQGYGSGDTSILLTTGHAARLIQNPPYNMTWWNATDYPDPCDDPNREIVRVTSVAVDTLVVTRAQEGTLATAKNTAAKTYQMVAAVTALTMTEIAAYLPAAGNDAEGNVIGSPGKTYMDLVTNTFWIKTTGSAAIGWTELIY